jgi:hypothetical protein
MNEPGRCSVVRADPDADRDRIVGLWARHLDRLGCPDRHYAWAYRDNPFAAGRNWLLVSHPDGRAVGVVGVIPRRMKVGSTTVLAARVAGFGIDPEHRCLGPALKLQRAVLAELGDPGPRFTYTAAPPHVVGVFRRLGYREVGEFARYTSVLDAEPYVRRIVGSERAARALAKVVNAGMRAVRRETRARAVVRPVARFDERFDDLWRRAKPGYGITSERSSRFLAWRFGPGSPKAYATVALASTAQDRILGYAVYYMAGTWAYIVDLFAENRDRAMRDLLAGLMRWLRDQGAAAATIEFPGADWLAATLRRFGFHKRPGGLAATLLVSPLSNESSNSSLGNARDWYFLGADDFR